MAGDTGPVTWDDLAPFIETVNNMAGKIETIPKPPAQTLPGGTTSNYHTPWIVQNYYLPHCNQASQEFPPGPPSDPKGTHNSATHTNIPAPTRTVVNAGVLQKAVTASQPDSADVTEPQIIAKPRMLATIERGLRPVRVPGPLTDFNTGRPMFLIPDGLPRAFRGRFNLGYEEPAKGVPGHWEFFSEGPVSTTGTGSAEELAHTNLGGQGYWTPDTGRPSADEVHDLRSQLHAGGLPDVTRGIDLSWVPDQNLTKEEREKLLEGLLPDRGNNKSKARSINPKPIIASEVEKAVNNLLKSIEPNSTSNDAAKDQTGKRKHSFFSVTPTKENEINMGGLDRDPVDNKAAIIEQRTRYGGQKSGSATQIPSTKTSRRTTRHTSVPTMPTRPAGLSRTGKTTSTRKGPARKEKFVLTSKSDQDAKLGNTNTATTDSQHGDGVEDPKLNASSPADEEEDSELSDLNEDVLEAGDPKSGTKQGSSSKQRHASEADQDFRMEHRRRKTQGELDTEAIEKDIAENEKGFLVRLESKTKRSSKAQAESSEGEVHREGLSNLYGDDTEPTARFSSKKRSASEADMEPDSERRKPRKYRRSERMDRAPMSMEQARADVRARLERARSLQDDLDTDEGFEEENQNMQDDQIEMEDPTAQEEDESSKGKSKGKGKKKGKR